MSNALRSIQCCSDGCHAPKGHRFPILSRHLDLGRLTVKEIDCPMKISAWVYAQRTRKRCSEAFPVWRGPAVAVDINKTQFFKSKFKPREDSEKHTYQVARYLQGIKRRRNGHLFQLLFRHIHWPDALNRLQPCSAQFAEHVARQAYTFSLTPKGNGCTRSSGVWDNFPCFEALGHPGAIIFATSDGRAGVVPFDNVSVLAYDLRWRPLTRERRGCWTSSCARR